MLRHKKVGMWRDLTISSLECQLHIVGDSLRRRGWTFAWSLSNMKKPLTKQLIEGAKVQIYHDISCNRIHADTYLQRRYGYIQGMPEGTKLPCNVKQDTDADMRNWSRRQLRSMYKDTSLAFVVIYRDSRGHCLSEASLLLAFPS